MNTFLKSQLRICKEVNLLQLCTVTVGRRFVSGEIKVCEEKENDCNHPSNLIILGKGRVTPKERKIKIIPDDCLVAREVKNCPTHQKPSLTWLDSLEDVNFVPEKVVQLHPEVFSDNPRIDFLHLCKLWQKNYREVDYNWKPTRAEVGRGKKKPWSQKGTGRARHGSTNSPLWKGGGVAHGPRGPRSLYQEILPTVRIRALTSALSIKFFQDDLVILKDLTLPNPEKDFLLEALAVRNMSEKSALLVHSNQEEALESDNISQAVCNLSTVNLMPLVGLNVWSLLHHDKLVLTLNALEELETKLTWHLHRYDWIDKPHNFYRDLPFKVKNSSV